MRHVLTVLLPISLMGCSVTVGEPERKAKVQALIKELADESRESRQTAYAGPWGYVCAEAGYS